MWMRTAPSTPSGFTLKSVTWWQMSPIVLMSSTVRRATASSTMVRRGVGVCVVICHFIFNIIDAIHIT